MLKGSGLSLRDVKSEIERVHTSTPSDMEILGDALQQCDYGAAYLVSNQYYSWYHAIGEVLKPKFIAEFGTRFGYSLISLIKGAGGSPWVERVWFWDVECYSAHSNTVASENLKILGIDFLSTRVDTCHLDTLGDVEVDLFHIDASHHFHGTVYDLCLAWRHLRSGGFMLVDDVDLIPEAKRAVDFFLCRIEGFFSFFLPTYRGLTVIHKERKDTRKRWADGGLLGDVGSLYLDSIIGRGQDVEQ